MPDDVVDRIYEAAFLPDTWPDVLDRIAAHAGGASGSLVVYDGDEVPSYKASALIVEDVDEFVRLGAWKQSARALSVNTPLAFEHSIRWIAPEEFLPRAAIEADSAQKLLRARGMEAQVGTGMTMMTGEVATYSMERWRQDGPFPSESMAALNTLRPHLARASLMAARLGLERAQNSVAVMEKLGLPAAVMTAGGRVLAANALLERMPETFIPRAGGGVGLSSHEADTMLRAARLDSRGGTHASVRSIPIPAAEGRPAVVIHVLPLRRAAHDIFNGGDLMLVATTARPGAHAPSPGILIGLFDLAPAEARLAAALARGKNLKASAAEQGIRFSTARTYLAHVFRKTGTHQQSELVALLKSTQPLDIGG